MPSHVYDLNRHVPYWSMPEADRRRFWDDHIHFTAAGYDLIGNKVGIALVSLLARQRGLEPQRPQQKRRKIAFKGDERRYDEEEDVPDPAVIDKGYVVVRYVDLE
jgi:transcriptional regulator GlxA family with amidase domain